MRVATYEAVVENGQIRLPLDLRLPDNTKVYVVVPGLESTPTACIASPLGSFIRNRPKILFYRLRRSVMPGV